MLDSIEELVKMLKHDGSRIDVDPKMILGAVKDRDFKKATELLKKVVKDSNKGSYVHGIYTNGLFVGKITQDFVTKTSWGMATAASITGLMYYVNNEEQKKMKSLVNQKQAENDALIQKNDELVKNNNKLVVTNNELVKMNEKCQAEVGICNSNFAYLIGKK